MVPCISGDPRQGPPRLGENMAKVPVCHGRAAREGCPVITSPQIVLHTHLFGTAWLDTIRGKLHLWASRGEHTPPVLQPHCQP